MISKADDTHYFAECQVLSDIFIQTRPSVRARYSHGPSVNNGHSKR